MLEYGLPLAVSPKMPSSPMTRPSSSSNSTFQVAAMTGSQTYWQVPDTCSRFMKLVKPTGPSPCSVAGRPMFSIGSVW